MSDPPEMLLRSVFDSAPDAFILVDSTGHIGLVNPQAECLFGYEQRDLVGQPASLLWPAAPAELPSCVGDRSDQAAPVELAGRRHDGREFPIEVRWCPLFSSAPGWRLAVIRDCGRRPAGVVSSETGNLDFAESLIHTAQAVVLVLDSAGRIVRFNPYTEQLIGQRLEQVQGMDWIPPGSAPALRARAGKFFSAPPESGEMASAVFPIVGRAGAQHDIHWNGRALVDHGGRVTGLLFTGHDVTELHQTQARLLEAERLAAIGQMAAGLAHESRNALQQIGACAEMLAMALVDQSEALDLVAGVQEAEARLLKLFDDVRAYAAPLGIDRRRADVAKVWRAAWSGLTESRGMAGAALVEDCAGVELSCDVDVAYLQQAFSNILENALDACGAGARLLVRCREVHSGQRTLLCVDFVDNGPGLKPEQQQRICEPFFTTKMQGSGLGMSIARRTIEAHGGHLEASCSPGGGAQIRIMLPRSAA